MRRAHSAIRLATGPVCGVVTRGALDVECRDLGTAPAVVAPPVGVMFAADIAIAQDDVGFGRLMCGSLGAGIAARSLRCRALFRERHGRGRSLSEARFDWRD